MSVIGAGAVALSVVAVATSVRARWRRREPAGSAVELWVLSAVVTLALVGLAASLLAVFGIFDRIALALSGATLAALLWPWERAPVPRVPRQGTRPLEIGMLLLLCAGALALRWPAMDYPLAGRDQGTYTLRAESILATGRLGFDDPILAEATAAEAAADRPGPADILGLYPRTTEPDRLGRYEGAYRPGWYLADRDRGRIVPQFLHLHPALLATFGAVVGPHAITGMVLVEAVLFVAVIFCLARRLFGNLALATLAGALIALDPLAIWVQRNALTETVTGVFFWAAFLAAARTRDHDPRDLDTSALLLGTLAWVRGNAWLAAPIVMLVLWLLPGRAPSRRRPVALYLALTVAGVLAHATTSFPYLADELGKQLGPLTLTGPGMLALIALGGVSLWVGVDAWRFHGQTDSPARAWLRRTLPAGLFAAAAVIVLAYLWLRAASDPAPYSRLDPALPLVGAPLLVCAVIALPRVATSTRLTRARDVWLAAGAATIVVTLALYAQRNLPQAGLYYYGRYLVPELLPAVVLLATATVHRLYGDEDSRPRRWLAWALGLLLLGTTAAPLVLHPVTRLREFTGAERIVDRLAAAIPADAIVIAGGEGWHHGHTFNQVGGALQVRYGRRVLPYASREAFYATAYELLVTRPAVDGRPPPPLFLLLGEATHHYRPDPKSTPLAAIDDLLPPPLVAREVTLVELFTDRLTPVTDELPTRVTRDELRMALFRIDVDGQGEHRLDLRRPQPRLAITGDHEITEHGLCMGEGAKVTIRLLDPPIDRSGSVVLVATPGTARVNPRLLVTIDDTPRGLDAAQLPLLHRDTLGPFPVATPPRVVTVRGFKRRRQAACPFGGLAELRILGPDRAALDPTTADAITLAPEADLGHPVEPTLWVGGRGLSRYRPGILPTPEIADRSIVVTDRHSATFPPEPLPTAGHTELDIIVTLKGSRVAPDTRLVLSADGEEVARLDPPDDDAGTWQSDPISWVPPAAVVVWSLRLEPATDLDRIRVRDIGLFSRGPVVASGVVE